MRIFGYEITVRRISDPLRGLRIEDVIKWMQDDPDREYGLSTKIARIKAVRSLRPGTGLMEAKDWVEAQKWPSEL